MLILILIDAQYSQNAVFALGKVQIIKITPQVLTIPVKNFPAEYPPTFTSILKNPV